MAKAVVESMPNGKIYVQSEKDAGSKFTVQFTPELVPGIETPPLRFGAGYEVELIGFSKDVPALVASRALVESQVSEWGFAVVDPECSTPVGSSDKQRIALVEESHGWDSFHIATLPPRLILLTHGQAISPSDPAGRVFLRKPLGPIKLQLALREIIRIHCPPPVLRLALPPPTAASLSSVSVAISTSMHSTPSLPIAPLPVAVPVDMVPHGRRMSHAFLSTRLPPPEVRPFKILIVDDVSLLP